MTVIIQGCIKCNPEIFILSIFLIRDFKPKITYNNMGWLADFSACTKKTSLYKTQKDAQRSPLIIMHQEGGELMGIEEN